MKRIQSYKFELRPDGSQRRYMLRIAGSCRFVYNKMLAYQKEQYESGIITGINHYKMNPFLPIWKRVPGMEFLKEAPAQSLQCAFIDLERAYINFFEKRTGFPKFKKKGRSISFRYSQYTKLEPYNNRIYLPKVGWVRYRNRREVLGTIKSVTVSFKNNKWFASIQTEREVPGPIHPSTSMIGIDLGITRFATFNDGTFIKPLNSFKKHETALKKAQRNMSRKKKFSKNWKKAKTRVQKIHTQIGNTRNDYLHKITNDISKNHAYVCIEDLKVNNMSKSASGTVDKPGRNVRAKSGLNKAILDQGWFEFRRQLDYKLTWRGGVLIVVPPRNTSRTCPACDHIAKENRLTQAKFECVECGFKENADVVGAINILRAGHARLACGEMTQSGHSLKQEPSETI